eukprot:m.750278 g.750278  ORF g.750278 m.750278 type:complete len:50 (+) comp23157_c0_seq1:1570-1719(+)
MAILEQGSPLQATGSASRARRTCVVVLDRLHFLSQYVQIQQGVYGQALQ